MIELTALATAIPARTGTGPAPEDAAASGSGRFEAVLAGKAADNMPAIHRPATAPPAADAGAIVAEPGMPADLPVPGKALPSGKPMQRATTLAAALAPITESDPQPGKPAPADTGSSDGDDADGTDGAGAIPATAPGVAVALPALPVAMPAMAASPFPVAHAISPEAAVRARPAGLSRGAPPPDPNAPLPVAPHTQPVAPSIPAAVARATIHLDRVRPIVEPARIAARTSEATETTESIAANNTALPLPAMSPVPAIGSPVAPAGAFPASRSAANASAGLERVDFGQLVETIARAREHAGSPAVQATLAHAEFGAVAMKFRHEGDTLAVSMTSADPGFAAAAAGAAQQAEADARQHHETARQQAWRDATPQGPLRDTGTSTGGAQDQGPQGQAAQHRAAHRTAPDTATSASGDRHGKPRDGSEPTAGHATTDTSGRYA